MKKYNLLNDILGWACFVVAAVTYLLTLEPVSYTHLTLPTT